MDAETVFKDSIGKAHIAAYRMYRTTKDVELQDLLQVARMALWVAIGSYDKTKGAFDPYICSRIKWALQDEVRRSGCFSRGKQRRKFISADDVILAGKDNAAICVEVENLLSKLPQRHGQIMRQYYYDGLNVSEIGKLWGVTRPAISQSLIKSRNKIRCMDLQS